MVDCRLVDRNTLQQFIAVFLGYLQTRSAYQPVIHPQNGRSIAHVGHHGGAAINPLTGATERGSCDQRVALV